MSIKSLKPVRALMRHLGSAAIAASICAAPLPSFAETTIAADAAQAIAGWLNLSEALGEQFASATPTNTITYTGQDGKGTFHVLMLDGGGYVATSGDTAFEPILAYSRTGEWVDDPAQNPLLVMGNVRIML